MSKRLVEFDEKFIFLESSATLSPYNEITPREERNFFRNCYARYKIASGLLCLFETKKRLIMNFSVETGRRSELTFSLFNLV